MTFERRRIGTERRKKSRIIPIFFIMILFVLLSGYFSVRSIGDTLIDSGSYTFEKGLTVSELPKALDLTIHPLRYKLYLRFFVTTLPKLQAGTYTLDETIALRDALDTSFDTPTHTDLTITILPGWNTYDIDSYLADKNILPAGSFLIAARDHFATFQAKYSFLAGHMTLEGFLYPDTYRILPTADAYMIIDRLLTEWEKKIGETYASLGKDAYENLILASIVEREERKSSEKAKVADILAKRVKEGIAMGADATVCYGYAKTQKQCTPAFISSVIGIKHPYNTRNMLGYPPTPISSISKDTWDAVLLDAPSPYYYYLHDSDGIIHYGITNTEHIQNKQKYLQ